MRIGSMRSLYELVYMNWVYVKIIQIRIWQLVECAVELIRVVVYLDETTQLK